MKEVANDISGTCTLVKRLSKSEKAFVTKKLSKVRGNKIHKQLFDLISKSESYEEAEIKKNFSEANGTVSYTLIKSQLLEMLLKYLAELETAKTIELQLFQKLEGAVILGKKLLRNQAIKIVNNVVKDAEKYDLFALQLKAYEVLIELTTRTQNFEGIEEAVTGINKLIEKQELHNRIFSHTHQVNHVFFRLNGKPEFKERFEEVKSKIVDIEHSSIKIRSAFNHLKGFVTMVYDGDYKKASEYFAENIRLIKDNPDYAERGFHIYKTAAYNLAICLDSLNDERGFQELMDEFKVPESSNGYQDAEAFGNMLVLQQAFLQARKRDKEVAQLFEQNESRIKNYSTLMSPGLRLAMYTNSCISYMTCGEWKKALKWNNAIINDQFEVSNDMVCFNKIINLIIHYELGNIELIESALPNLFRYLVARDYYNSTFKLLFNFFQEFIKDYDREKELKLFRDLQKDLEIVKVDDKFNQREMVDFIVAWVRSKVK